MPVVRFLAVSVDYGDDVAASIRKNIAVNLRGLIDASGLTQKEAADKLGYSESRLSNWLNEKNFMEERVFERIREVFGWTYDRLVRDPIVVSATALEVALEDLANDAGYDLVKRNSH